MIRFAEPSEENVVEDVLNVLDRWYIAASGDEVLWIQPRRNVLDLRDFCTLLKRLHRLFRDRPAKVLVLYFDGVEMPKSLWLIVLRLLSAFAKSMQTECRIIRSIRVRSASDADRAKMKANSEGKESGCRFRPMMKLDGISVMIQPGTNGGR